MPDEDLLPSNEPPIRTAAPKPARITCEFCGSQLAPSGEVMKLGDDARRYRDLNDKAESDKLILQSEIRGLKTKLAELEAQLPRRESGSGFFG